jgi:uncharacterized protein (DUF1697 family)
VSTYVALLRAINLGDQNKIRMPDLKELFAALGYSGVSTYLRSGNVVFDGPPEGIALASSIEDAIAQKLGLRVRVLLRDAGELGTVAKGNPFTGPGAQPGALHVTFLDVEPDHRRVESIDAGRFQPDEYRVTGRHVYLHCPQGYGRTKLNNAFWERQLGLTATTRNWNTVQALWQLAGG